MVKRRTFLQSTVAGIGALTNWRISPTMAGAFPPSAYPQNATEITQDDYRPPEWLHYSRAVLFDGYSPPVYPHLKDFDARRLVAAVVEVGAGLLRFQPIGYWAYYPSKAFPVHQELGGRDLIDEVARECRRAGIRQYCYTGYGVPLMLTPGYVKEHPQYADWLLRDPAGKPYGFYSHYGWSTPMRRLCTTGETFRAGMRQVVRELCAHDIDGVYFDEPSPFGYSGVCFCDSCRRSFKKFSGLDLDRLAGLVRLNGLPSDWGQLAAGADTKTLHAPPESAASASLMSLPDVDMKTLIAWYAWANELDKEDLLDFRKIIHGSGKFMLCHNGSGWRGGTLHFQYRIPDGFMVEASRETYDRLMTGLMGASMARPYKKLAQMYMGSYAVAWFGEPPHERPWATHNTNVEDRDEIRMEGFTELACGNAPFYATANRLYFEVGSGSQKPAQEVFGLMQRIEDIQRDSVAVSYATIVPTWESLQLPRTKRKSWNWPVMSGGMGLAMLDERISFDVNPSTEMSEEWLRGQKVIALCGASGVSDEDARKLADWVKAGGGLLATYDTGLYDGEGNVRQGGGALKEVLGVEMKGEPLESQPECYYRVKEKHEALGEYGPGSIVEGDGRLVLVEPLGGAKVLAECWNLGTEEVRGPAIVANSYGQGRTLYVSGSLEANYLYDRVLSTKRLLRSMVEYLGRDLRQPFKLKAPEGVYGVLRRATNGDLALWVLGDVGFKDAASGRMRQTYVSVPDVEVAIRIPAGRMAKGMHLMRSDQDIAFHDDDGYAVATIPHLHIAEIVHLILG